MIHFKYIIKEKGVRTNGMLLKIKMWIARMCQYILYFTVPLKKNRIMLYAHHRSGYVCNPGALLRYLEANHPGQWDLIWVTEYPENLPQLPGVRICGRRSFQYFRTFIRTKIFITNDMVDENLIKKPGQIFISTWHGGGCLQKGRHKYLCGK